MHLNLFKPLVAGALLLGLHQACEGQGTVDFNNDNLKPPPGRRVRQAGGGTGVVGSNYVAQLYYGPDGADPSSLTPVLSPPAHFDRPPTIRAGFWFGDLVTLLGFNPGDLVTLQVRVWDSSLAPTWEQAVILTTGEVGESTPFSYLIPGAGLPIEAYAMANFTGFTLRLAPEPNTGALLALGAACLWWRRRRAR